MVKMRGVALFIWLLTPLSGLAEEFVLQVKNNLSPGHTLYVAIYREASGDWQSEPDYRLKQRLPQSHSLELPLDIPAGQYALRAFIDLNDDQTLNTRSLDRPTEPFASSIGAGRRHPSVRFEHSVVSIDKDHPQAVLTLRYPKGSKPDHDSPDSP